MRTVLLAVTKSDDSVATGLEPAVVVSHASGSFIYPGSQSLQSRSALHHGHYADFFSVHYPHFLSVTFYVSLIVRSFCEPSENSSQPSPKYYRPGGEMVGAEVWWDERREVCGEHC